MAPEMAVHPVLPSAELSHTHDSFVTPPSGSVSVAVTSASTPGYSLDSVRLPASSAFVTVMVTAMESSTAVSEPPVAFLPSLTDTVTL